MYQRAKLQNKENEQYVVFGHIVWREKDSFGFEFEVCESSATMTCFYDEWNITYLDN